MKVLAITGCLLILLAAWLYARPRQMAKRTRKHEARDFALWEIELLGPYAGWHSADAETDVEGPGPGTVTP